MVGFFVGSTRVSVDVSVGVGVIVGSGVEVKVGRLVADGMGVSVGFGTKAMQDVNGTTRTKKRIALLNDFILHLAGCGLWDVLSRLFLDQKRG